MAVSKRLIVGISGASGFIYGYRLLQILQPLDVTVHLVLSKAAQRTRALETEISLEQVTALADVSYAAHDVAASIASGSFKTMGMIVAPCSTNTLSKIANGVTDNLLTRSADVVLKEQRRLVLLLRESPLHMGHLQSMLQAARLGAVVAPTVPAFYNQPQSLEDVIDHSLGRALDLFDFDLPLVKRWERSETTPL